MPIYCFSNGDKVIEREFHMDEVPDTVKVGKRVYERDLRAEMPNTQSSSGWPMECVASGVNAEQAPELREHFKKNGLNIDVTNDGDPIYKSATERRKAFKCRGLFDKSSYI